MSKRKLKLSASAIQAFKACPYRFYMAYVLGVRQAEVTEGLRMGTMWHKIMEMLAYKPGDVCRDCAEESEPDSNCIYCRGEQFVPEDTNALIMAFLDEAYKNHPYLDAQEAAIEKVKLLYCALAYKWYYENDEYEIIRCEQQFRLPIRAPETGRALLNVELMGKIDKIYKYPNGLYALGEHKTTGMPINTGSSYWDRLAMDTQKNTYIYAVQQLQWAGDLPIDPKAPLITQCYYDVFHKPTIKPKKLTQADTKKLVKTGEYCGQTFEVEVKEKDPAIEVHIDGEKAQITPGKKADAYAIHETPYMYGARLFCDIVERPDFYFARKEIPTSNDELAKFKLQLYNITKMIQSMRKNNWWFRNESQCEATFKCPYTPFCYNNVEPDVNNLPNQYKCIFNDERG